MLSSYSPYTGIQSEQHRRGNEHRDEGLSFLLREGGRQERPDLVHHHRFGENDGKHARRLEQQGERLDGCV